MQISWLLTWFITRLFSIQAPSPKNWVKPRYEAIKKWVPYWFSPTSLPQMGLVSHQIAQPFQSLASVPLMLEIILFFSLDKTHRTCCWKVVTEQVMEAFLHYIACQKKIYWLNLIRGGHTGWNFKFALLHHLSSQILHPNNYDISYKLMLVVWKCIEICPWPWLQHWLKDVIMMK